jgi:hypothetical protein
MCGHDAYENKNKMPVASHAAIVVVSGDIRRDPDRADITAG